MTKTNIRSVLTGGGSLRRWTLWGSSLAVVGAFILTLSAARGGEPRTFEVQYTRDGRVADLTEDQETVSRGIRVIYPSKQVRSIPSSAIPTVFDKYSGEATLLVVWASWCPSCRKIMPLLGKLAENWREKGLSIIGLSIDEDPARFRKYARRFARKFEVMRVDDPKDGRLDSQLIGLGVQTVEGGIPRCVWFDKDKKAVAEWSGAVPYESLEEIAAKLLQGGAP